MYQVLYNIILFSDDGIYIHVIIYLKLFSFYSNHIMVPIGNTNYCSVFTFMVRSTCQLHSVIGIYCLDDSLIIKYS